MGEAPRRWTPLLGRCVWERFDGLRFHTGGLVSLQGERPRQWSPMLPSPEVKRHRVWIHALERAYPTDDCWRCDSLVLAGVVEGWTWRIPVDVCGMAEVSDG